MIYLAFACSDMSVKEVSKMLGQKHDPVNSDLQQLLRVYIKTQTFYKTSKHKGLLKFVKIKNVDYNDVPSWVVNFSLSSSKFCPVAYMEIDDGDLNLNKNHQKVMGERIHEVYDIGIEYFESLKKTKCVVHPRTYYAHTYKIGDSYERRMKIKFEEISNWAKLKSNQEFIKTKIKSITSLIQDKTK